MLEAWSRSVSFAEPSFSPVETGASAEPSFSSVGICPEQPMTEHAFDRARLPRLRAAMSGYVDRGEIPGIVTLVARRDELHVEAMGTRVLSGPEPMRGDTIFRLASLTKPIAAAAVMVLVEGCRPRLDRAGE